MTCKPAIVFVESNTSGTGADFVRQAVTMGFDAITLTSNPTRYPYLERGSFRSVLADTSDFTATMAAVNTLRQSGPVAAVWSSSEYFILSASQIAHQLGLPAPSSEAIAVCRDKYSLRQFLLENRLDTVPCHLARNEREITEAVQRLGSPVVVKPRKGSGSLGVRLCASIDEAWAHAIGVFETVPNAREEGLIIEPFIDGVEYSVEVFDGTPVCIVKKKLGKPPYFVETGHDLPANITASLAGKVNSFAQRIADAVGLSWGPAHLELKVETAGTIHLIEANPRLAGGYLPSAIKLAGGPDLIEQTLRRALGDPTTLNSSQLRPTSIRFILADMRDCLSDMTLGILSEESGVSDVRLYEQVGRDATLRNDFRDRIGHVIAHGETSVAASDRAENALRRLHPASGCASQPAQEWSCPDQPRLRTR